VGLLGGVILGEGADLTLVVDGAAAGAEAKGAVTRVLELTVGHFCLAWKRRKKEGEKTDSQKREKGVRGVYGGGG
jgi:hypothetical protein